MSTTPGQPDQPIDARGVRVAIVASRFNPAITNRLLEGAVNAFRAAGGADTDLTIVRVPGAFELPVAAARLARSGACDAVVALGCLIRGETVHDRVIADAVAGALSRIAVETGVPIGFGLLTTDTLEQAAARAGGGRGNKGADAMNAAIETVRTLAPWSE